VHTFKSPFIYNIAFGNIYRNRFKLKKNYGRKGKMNDDGTDKQKRIWKGNRKKVGKYIKPQKRRGKRGNDEKEIILPERLNMLCKNVTVK
jgi:hypothetical protein